jgi:hypothetical protein
MPGVPMRSTDFRAIVEPILNEEFDGLYEQRTDEWKGPFREITGTPRNYHEEPVLFGMGAAPETPDGSPINYDAGGTLFTKRYQYRVYGLAFALTQVLVEDGDHIRIGQIYSRHLAQSLIETKETLTANVLNRAFNGSYLGGDGVALVSTAHPIAGGTFSNQLSVAAALSQTSLEQMLIQVRQAVDNNGKKIRLMPRAITCAPANIFQAETILKSALRTSTANNDINPIITMKLLAEGQFNMSRLTSPTAWWINTDAPEGLKLVKRRGLKRSMEGDFETDTMRYKSTERYTVGWTDPRAVFGTAGL